VREYFRKYFDEARGNRWYSLESTMKTNPIAQDSGRDFSFWFAGSSPLLGVLLAILA